MNYFKILEFLSKGNRSEFDVPVSEQKAYLYSLKAASNYRQRSYNQYLCQNYFVPRWKKDLFNLISLVLYIPLLFVLTIKRINEKKYERIVAISESTPGEIGILPKEITSQWEPNNKVWGKGLSLSIRDWYFVLRIFLYHLKSPYFALKIMMNVAKYSGMIGRYEPAVLIAENECSFSSSLLTEYCHLHGIKHLNVMHGDKLFNIRDSFFSFDKCYIWDEHYEKLFLELRAAPNQFVISIPDYVKMDLTGPKSNEIYADYKYYLEDYTEEELKGIIVSMSFAKQQGETVKYRPHPRYSDVGLLEKYVDKSEIEYPCQVNIVDSLTNTRYAVGSCTTVLLQAYCSGKDVIIDDVAVKSRYDKLAEMKYILAGVSIPKLSEFQE